jgi:hypothetical protein
MEKTKLAVMEAREQEIGVEILLRDNLYYQIVKLYDFVPKTLSFSNQMISLTKIDKEEAKEIIEKLALKEIKGYHMHNDVQYIGKPFIKTQKYTEMLKKRIAQMKFR